MLKRFAVKNYRGFREELVWDLSQAGNYQFNTHAVKDGIIKNGVIYGTNGSGKSNLGLAVIDIVHHLNYREYYADCYDNYLYAGASSDTLVEFHYTFQLGAQVLDYKYAKDKSGNLHVEDLQVDKARVLFKDVHEIYFAPEFTITEEVKKMVHESQNNLSLIKYIRSNTPLGQEHYIMRLMNFVEGMEYYNTLMMQHGMSKDFTMQRVEKLIIEYGLVGDYQEFLLNVSGQKVEFLPSKDGDEDLYCLINGQSILWRKIASQGTKALTMLYLRFRTMSIIRMRLMILDEFDAFYHHELSDKVCRELFGFDDIQVFMTTHHTSIMTNDLLRPDCYFVIDGKEIKPISKMTKQELRQAHNLEKMYRGKAFSL